MLSGSLKLRSLLLAAFAFLCVHAVTLVVFRAHATAATYPFLILAPLLALGVCWRQADIMRSRARLPWVLFSAGLLLWTGGMVLSAWEELFQHIPADVAFYSDFVYFLYGVPILLAISSPAEEQRVPLFVWLDGIQAVLTAYLTYIALFAVVPFTTRTIHPISVVAEIWVYNAENLVLAGAATLRVLAQPRDRDERRFFRILCSFLWVYGVCAAIYNYDAVMTQGHTVTDLLVDLPFLFLAVAMLLPVTRKEDMTLAVRRGPLAIFLGNASPIFYTLPLLALGLATVRLHFYVGMVAIVIGLVVYGIRTTALQSRYLQAQQALQEARDRLEEVSLTDELTKVANRRCFSQILELEWNRAMRMQQPLALLMIDVDYFKNLNDQYGHLSGDQCLAAVAAALRSILPRAGDVLARYGGEEFAVILPATNMGGAQAVADRVQEAVRALNIPNETSLGRFTTVSVGIAVYEFPQAGSPAALIAASDRALYKAKQNGRDRIEYCPIQTILNGGSAG
jgi:diguanylate cyclase (GGDEF)-like protein